MNITCLYPPSVPKLVTVFSRAGIWKTCEHNQMTGTFKTANYKIYFS